MTAKTHLMFSIGMTLFVGAAIAWGIAVVGSPTMARVQRFDRQRLADLKTIFREVQSLCHDRDIKDKLKRELPKSLAELAAQARSEKINLNDPQTGQPYTYRVTGPTSYQLCATFSLGRDSDREVFWNHTAGKQCFTINALDPP